MTTNVTTGQKTVVQQLNFGAKTAKRVSWESYEFSIEAPHLVRVTNASWGFQKDDHSYLVGVEVREDVAVPAECGCKADPFNEECACKHRVACATIGGSVVLNAATEFETPETTEEPSTETTMADKLVRADGGTTPLDESNHDECDCAELSDLPCFECYREGKKSL